MTVKERILIIRLLEKAERYGAFMKALGIEPSGAEKNRESTKNLI